MTEIKLTPVSHAAQSTTDQVFEALYGAVISLQLPPGSKVSESEIAKQLNVSRQPVRDAFFRLSNLGFLSIRPQRATLITPISEQAVLDAMFTRTALEVECLRVVVSNLTDTGLTDLRNLLTQQQNLLENEDKSAFHASDEAFHEKLCQLAGHAHAWALIRAQKAHLDRIRFLSLSEQRQHHVVAEHTEFLYALAQRDALEAERLLRRHLQGVEEILPHIRRSFPEYFEAKSVSL